MADLDQLSPVDMRSIDDLQAYRDNTLPLVRVLTDESIEHFVVSAPKGLSRPRIGIPRSALNDLWDALARNADRLPTLASTSIAGQHSSAVRTHQLRDLLGTPPAAIAEIIFFTPMRNPATGRSFAATHGCVLEVWNERSGALHRPGERDEVVITTDARLRPAEIDLLGMQAHTYEPLGALDILDIQFPIDVVYLWVDGSDPEWRAKKDKAAGTGSADESQIPARFRQFDELRYSLRSLSRYAPWVNRVYLVTDSQRPRWLEESGTNLTVIDHNQILPKTALPTFNSHALTARLHHIPELSDHFILFNDDILLGRQIRAERFMNSNGTTRFFLSRHLVSRTPKVAHEHARLRTCDLIEQHTGMRPTRLFWHTPHAISKQLMATLEQEFASQWSRTVHNTFRADADIVPSYLYHYVGYVRGLTAPASISYRYLALEPESIEDHLASYRRERPSEVLCLNDTGGQMTLSSREQLERFFEELYPHPSPYEVSS